MVSENKMQTFLDVAESEPVTGAGARMRQFYFIVTSGFIVKK